jgi:hypothetical protein
MEEKVRSVVSVFPDYEERIDFLFIHDENFRDLCADYILCASRVRELKTELEIQPKKLEEYEELQHHLEEEILNLITVKRK